MARSIWGMDQHRIRCPEWRNRPNPRGLMIHRLAKAHERWLAELSPGPCPECGRYLDHYADCPEALKAIDPDSPVGYETSGQERSRRARIVKVGIDIEVFEALLRALAKR